MNLGSAVLSDSPTGRRPVKGPERGSEMCKVEGVVGRRGGGGAKVTCLAGRVLACRAGGLAGAGWCGSVKGPVPARGCPALRAGLLTGGTVEGGGLSSVFSSTALNSVNFLFPESFLCFLIHTTDVFFIIHMTGLVFIFFFSHWLTESI